MKIAIMMPNWVGDLVMSTPALRALRGGFPEARLIGIVRPHLTDVLQGTPWLDEVRPFSRKQRGPEGRSWRLSRQLRGERLDKFLLLTNSLSTAWIAWCSGAKQRIGFARNGRDWMLTHRLKAPRLGGSLLPRSAVDHYLDVARAAGVPVGSKQLQLATTGDEERAADRVWDRYRLHDAQHVVVLNTGAAYGPAKNWPNDYYAMLGRQIGEELDAAVLVICGPAEREAAQEIVTRAHHPRVHCLPAPLSIGVSKACVRRGHLMVSTDSGPRHFAAAFDVPLITLFGSTDPRWSDPYHERAVDLRQPMSCSPCARRVCPLGHHRCMRELTPDRVLSVVRQTLAGCQSTSMEFSTGQPSATARTAS
jgi:heptosyltransferase-2